jgi:hypothetical protein
MRFFALAFGFWLWGLLVWETFGREKTAEGKRIAERELLKRG